MSDPADLTIADARDLLARRALSSRELAAAHIDAMERRRDLNCYITETPERALAMADAADGRIAAGGAGRLEGIPLAVKDLFCTKDVRTTAGSRILGDFRPFYESTVTARLFGEGAVLLGKANLDEFAMGSSNLTSFFGPAINPWRGRGDDADLVPGGSSGGSAAAVAARLAAGATGTDTGGSIRQPAAFTGVVGVKPTYGRCSRWGIVAFASSLDQAGPLTRTVRDAAIMLGVMAGHDPMDSTSADIPVPDYEAALEDGVKGMTVGVPKEYAADGMAEEIVALWHRGIAWLEEQGAAVRGDQPAAHEVRPAGLLHRCARRGVVEPCAL